jgi:hypothetical protein
MTIKCNCADKLDKSNAEHLLRYVEIRETKISSLIFRESDTVKAATEFWKNARSMLEMITKLPDCK